MGRPNASLISNAHYISISHSVSPQNIVMRLLLVCLVITACVAVDAASNVVFPMHTYTVAYYTNCSDACSLLSPPLPCSSGVNVTTIDVYRIGECVGGGCTKSACDRIDVHNAQVCACLDKDILIDVSSNDTQTISVAAVVFNVSSISDECTSLHTLQLQRDLNELNVIGLCDPSNYVVNALAACDLIQNNGIYVSFTTDVAVRFECIIRF